MTIFRRIEIALVLHDRERWQCIQERAHIQVAMQTEARKNARQKKIQVSSNTQVT